MKALLIFALMALTPLAQADTKADLAKVRAKAEKIASGADVRWKFSTYENTEGNPCADEGTSYIAELFVRKSLMKLDRDGNPTQERRFQSFNRYSIAKADLDKGDSLSDALCQE